MPRFTTFLAIAAAGFPAGAFAQVLTQPGAGGGNAGGSSSPPASRQTGNQPQGQTLGGDLPFLDPGSEVITWDGRMWNVTDNRVFSARFEKYLAAPAADSEEDQAYREVINEILRKLSPSNPGGANLPAGVALLPEAAQFYIDAKLCDSLANAIWGVWLSQKNNVSLNAANEAMTKRRRELEWNYEVGSEGRATAQPAAPAQGGGGRGGRGGGNQGGGQQNQTASQTAGEMSRIAGYVKDALELEAKIKLNQAEIGISAVKMKLEFQALLVQFFLQRRFEHVVMGSRFYRNLFQDGDGTLELKDGSDVQKMFASGLGFDPTVATLDTFANEAIRDVDEGVRAFEELASRGDFESASKRLSEAFVVGEYLPRVRRLPMEQKRLVLEFVRDSNQLISSLEVRNFGLAEEVLNRMKNAAKDFDYSKPEAAIQASKTVATMHLTKAKVAAMKGQEDVVAEEMRKATEVWPNNPALSELAGLIGQNADVQAEAIIQLDRLISERAHRKISADKGRFLASVATDPQRLAQLEQILTSVAEIDMVIYASQQQERNGNVWAAWETVKRSLDKHPDDGELARRIQVLTESATELVGVLSKAKSLEQDGEYGSSLARYLEALDIYPASEFARDGIDRVLSQIRPASSTSSGAPVEYQPEPAAAPLLPEQVDSPFAPAPSAPAGPGVTGGGGFAF